MITSLEDYERAMNIADSPNWGANLCLGCCSEKGGSALVKEMLYFFLDRKKLLSLHFRDVKGSLPNFAECFLGEGNFSPPEILKILIEKGYDGPVMEDHVPHMVNDTTYGHRARAYELGYIGGMIDMLNYLA
jgi:mannonate dehydratase